MVQISQADNNLLQGGAEKCISQVQVQYDHRIVLVSTNLRNDAQLKFPILIVIVNCEKIQHAPKPLTQIMTFSRR